MRRLLLVPLFLVAVLLTEGLPASTAWKPDHKFQTEILNTGAVRAMLVQPDGKTLVAGDFTSFDGVPHVSIVRLSADGTLDPGFVPRFAPASYTVTALALQPDGKILLAGFPAYFNSATRLGVCRLNPDGSEDPTFSVREQPGSNYGGPSLNALVVQPDGKIIVAGDFNRVGDQECLGLIRLNPDGSRDPGFDLQAGSNRYFAVLVQADGKILAGGDGLTRFNSDGSLDPTYQPALPSLSRVSRLAPLEDGKLVVAGEFWSDLLPAENVLRLNADGSRDPAFQASGLPTFTWVSALTLDADGQILVGGVTDYTSSADSTVLARLGPDGTADPAFSPDLHGSGGVQSLVAQDDGQILVGSGFYRPNGQGFPALARLHADGALDKTFEHAARTTGSVYKLVAQPDGKLLLLGAFDRINGEVRRHLARLLANGAPDPGFQPEVAGSEYVEGLTLLPNGQILLDGQFDPVDGETTHAFARLNADGSRDRAFRSAVPVADYVDTAVGLPDGKFLVAGGLLRKNGKARPDYIHRFNADGSRDRTFHPDRVLVGGCDGLGVQSDGKIVLAGKIRAKGKKVAAVVRLGPDGALDPGFTATMDESDTYDSESDYLRELRVQSDDKVVMAGEIHHVNGVPCSGLIRLNANGSLDTTYRAGATSGDGLQDAIYDLVPLPGGWLFAAGWFTEVDGAPRHHAALFEADGSLNAAFNPDTDEGGEIYTAAPVGGRLVVAGGFRRLDGRVQGSVARLKEKH